MKKNKCDNCCVGFYTTFIDELDNDYAMLVFYDMIGFVPIFLNSDNLHLFNYCPYCRL